MPIGPAAAMLIGTAVSAGTQVVGAKMQSSAAKKAAKTQQQGTDRALQVQQQALQPYQDIGRAGLQQLQNPAFAQPYRPVFGSGSNGAQAFGGPPQMPQGPPPTLGGIGQPPPQAMAPQRPQGPPSGAPGMVLVEAPTGERQMLPLVLAQQAQARGARILGGA